MRSNFLKLSVLCCVLALVAFGSLGAVTSSQAAQSTMGATMAASMSASMAPTMSGMGSTMSATMSVTMSSTMMSTMSMSSTMASTMAAGSSTQFAPCPNAATMAATMSGTMMSTMSATMAASMAATTVPKAYLGVSAEQVQQCGARVLEVKAGTPAEKAGLQVNDVIVAVDGKAISGLDELRTAIQGKNPGDTVRLTYLRGSQQSDVTVTLAAIPADTTATMAATMSSGSGSGSSATMSATMGAGSSATMSATMAATAR